MLQAPFPWFGGKSRAASAIWQRLGDVPNYVEPFAGSLAVMLGRPSAPGIETANDLDGYLANFWRAVAADPDAVSNAADWPVNEADLHARHVWLVAQRETLTARLMGDPQWFDAKIAGWWVWGASAWIGSGWCSGKGPWHSVNGELVRLDGDAGQGVNRQLPHLGTAGQGVNRQLPLYQWMQDLSSRLRRVRVACGDWSRVVGPSVTEKHGLTGIVLDPPYFGDRAMGLYSNDDATISVKVREWAISNGSNPKLRIVLCGYEDEHPIPADWERVYWSAKGGYGSQNSNGNANNHRETLWFSPHCLRVDLFGGTL